MDLKHLRSFAAAAERLSFTQAGKELKLTQAAVSQHIAALETELGAPLFERKGRGVQLTERGSRLYAYARRILDLVAEAVRESPLAAADLRGTLRIAASTVPAEQLIPQLLARFRERYPLVRETIAITDSGGATRAVLAAKADVGFVGELPKSSQLKAKPIAADELLLVVSPAHRWAGARSITLRQLRTEPLIIREAGSGSRHCLEHGLESHAMRLDDLKVVMEMNSNDAIREAVHQNAGVAFCSASVLADALHDGKVVRVPVRGLRLKRQLYLITHRNQVDTPVLKAFLEFVEAV